MFRLKRILSCVLLVVLVNCVHAQYMNIHFTDNTGLSYELVDIQNIQFSGDVLNLLLTNGSTESWNVSLIQGYTIDQTSSINDGVFSPSRRKLNVYPNPSSTEINIEYSLPASDHVRLSLFDVEGKEVLVVFDGIKPSGDRLESVSLPLEGLKLGTYFCYLKTSSYTTSSKLIILD